MFWCLTGGAARILAPLTRDQTHSPCTGEEKFSMACGEVLSRGVSLYLAAGREGCPGRKDGSTGQKGSRVPGLFGCSDDSLALRGLSLGSVHTDSTENCTLFYSKVNKKMSRG